MTLKREELQVGKTYKNRDVETLAVLFIGESSIFVRRKDKEYSVPIDWALKYWTKPNPEVPKLYKRIHEPHVGHEFWGIDHPKFYGVIMEVNTEVIHFKGSIELCES